MQVHKQYNKVLHPKSYYFSYINITRPVVVSLPGSYWEPDSLWKLLGPLGPTHEREGILYYRQCVKGLIKLIN